VVALANEVIAAASGVEAGVRLTLTGQRPPGPAPRTASFADEPAEAVAVAARCRELISSGTPASEIAVLFRTNAQSAAYETALADAGVPYVVRGVERFFERPEVREAMVLLRGAARAIEPGQALAEAIAETLSAVGFRAGDPPSGGSAREKWEALAALVRLGEDFAAANEGATLATFTDELAERAAVQHAPTVEGVTLASLHAAKGLEWDAVFLVGLAEGTMPITFAKTPAQLEEERRLLYVGITRARAHLALTWTRRPSRFLRELGVAPRGESRTRRSDEELPPSFRTLKEWRLERAKADEVPAYVIFHNSTLEAIAERQPRTLAELGTVPGVGPAKLERYGPDVLAALETAA
jgi:DNA helicase-2/ATP-dependent DNA helicase PcrA